MNIERINEYIKNTQNIHSNIIYCFMDDYSKLILKPLIKQGDTSLNTYTELWIQENNIRHKNSPIYLYTEYIKLSREMTQTPLRIKGKLKCDRSVSDFTKQLKIFFQCKDIKFIPSGREDIDVMMISGRPCLIKIIEPKANLEFSTCSLVLYKCIDLINFLHVTRNITKFILSGEKVEKKIYKLFLVSNKEIVLQDVYNIKQKTPLRVIHRRSNMIRERVIEIIDWKMIVKDIEGSIEDYKGDNRLHEVEDNNIYNTIQMGIFTHTSNIEEVYTPVYFYEVYIRASAGTYIKEFVHGDHGRTVPSLSTKGIWCDLLELDVLEVEKKDIPKDMVIRNIDLIKTYID